MFLKHKGESMLEWIVLAVLVVAVLGLAVYSLGTSAQGEATRLSSWLTGLSLP
jgi:hypothetical protein